MLYVSWTSETSRRHRFPRRKNFGAFHCTLSDRHPILETLNIHSCVSPRVFKEKSKIIIINSCTTVPHIYILFKFL